jgi:D-glycero-D-manno-heptose 1,7-bisphosphate phosphatase
MNKAAFLDRDGVLNRKAHEGAYVTRWEDMEFLPGTYEAVRLLNDAEFLVIVVSNQRCVAKELVSTDELDSIHARMRNQFAATGATIDAIYYCPHDEDPPCSCRKPEAGMLFEAAQEHDIDLAASWMIGDSEHDVKAGKKAGCRTILLTPDARPEVRLEVQDQVGNADLIASSLLDATGKILHKETVAS